MKVVHVLKRIEMIDDDIKELKKLEKTIARDKSFSTPIYLSIEKQINLLLGERISLLELKILNPPESFINTVEGPPEERQVEAARKQPQKTAQPVKPKIDAKIDAKIDDKADKEKSKPDKDEDSKDEDSIDDIPMVTQDLIDAKFTSIKNSESKENVKILDVALEKGTLQGKEEREKKVRFFRENFPID